MARPKLLVADDSVTIRKVFELAFEHEPVELLLTGSGAEALEQIALDPPDIVVADVNMPDMDGFELCRIVKQTAGPDIPVYLLASGLDEFDEARAEEVGADGRFEKPFRSEEMVSQVLAALPEPGEEDEAATVLDDEFDDIDIPLEGMLAEAGFGAADEPEDEDEEVAGEPVDDDAFAVEEAPAAVSAPAVLTLNAAAAAFAGDDEDDDLEVEVVDDPASLDTDEAFTSHEQDQSSTRSGLPNEIEEGASSLDLPAAGEEELSEEARAMLRALEAEETADTGHGALLSDVPRAMAAPDASDEEQRIADAIHRIVSPELVEQAVTRAVEDAVASMSEEIAAVVRQVTTQVTLPLAEEMVRRTIEQIRSENG